MRSTARERIASLFDEGTFVEFAEHLTAGRPLGVSRFGGLRGPGQREPEKNR
jgi:acetyl-CoA carboxylase beta subunit